MSEVILLHVAQGPDLSADQAGVPLEADLHLNKVRASYLHLLVGEHLHVALQDLVHGLAALLGQVLLRVLHV